MDFRISYLMAQIFGANEASRNLLGNFYIGDFFDVLIISIFLYTAIYLFKQTRSLRILVGIGIVLLLYILAQIFNLGLTLQFLHYFFGFFLVIFVVVFQEELRK